MKSSLVPVLYGSLLSLPSRGARVEILSLMMEPSALLRRSPRGERGLKYHSGRHRLRPAGSLPSRGARVEIRLVDTTECMKIVAPLAGSEG